MRFQLQRFGFKLLIFLAVLTACVSLQGCIPIYYRSHEQVPLLEPSTPVVSAALSAPRGAQAVSIVRPSPEPGAHELYRAMRPLIGGFGGPGGGIIIVVLAHRTFELSADPTIWAADALKARLENAGYKVRDVDTSATATTPIVIRIAISTVSAEPGIAETGHKGACAVTVNARINIVEEEQSVFNKSFEGMYQQPAQSCLDSDVISLALKKALENLLDNAFPVIAPVLAHATQPQRQQRHDLK